MSNNYIAELLEFIYGKQAAHILPRLTEILEKFKKEAACSAPALRATEITNKDALLISYGDILSSRDARNETALSRLEKFLGNRNRGDFSYLHLLPFHPYSSDDGFSVIDYREVDPRAGTWDDIGKLGESFKMVFDFVINHGSVKSEWFTKFLAGEEKYARRYVTRPHDYDYHLVTRPRTHPLLSEFQKKDGAPVHVWTTFSADQADYDFSDAATLLEFVEIFLDYYRRGGRMLRLDAIAYLWKEDGTSCLHHPKTHAVVRLLRAIIDRLDVPMFILTETNVPHTENLSYFGGAYSLDGKAGQGGVCPDCPEAHLVYNFALPPLVLHAAVSGNARPLSEWAGRLPVLPEGNYFLNFLASHDGVGLSPALGLVDEAEFARTLEIAKERGALISMKSTEKGPIPYELNCSWADMVSPADMGTPAEQARAFLGTYAIALALPGLPAVYFHSWTGSRAWKEGPALLGYNRAINREKPRVEDLEKDLENPSLFRSLVLAGFHRMFEFRRSEDAFMPSASCKVLASGKGVFALLREAPAGARALAALTNFSDTEELVEVPRLGAIQVAPRGTRWIAFDTGGGKRELAL